MQFSNPARRPGTTSTWLRAQTELPILLKGILHPDDARAAATRGVDGVVVSNHGGRQVDGAIGALDALPGVVDAVGDDLPVLFDSGIRCGADVVKALALGADATLLGRPYLWGLALAGEDGVRSCCAPCSPSSTSRWRSAATYAGHAWAGRAGAPPNPERPRRFALRHSVGAVAPGDQLAHRAEVIAPAVAADAEDEVLDAGRDEVVGVSSASAWMPQVRSISPGSRPTSSQWPSRISFLLLVRLGVAEAVPHVGVLGDELERDLLAAAADQDRQLAHRRRVELAEALLDPRQVALSARRRSGASPNS